MCFTPFIRKNSSKSRDTNWGPLSETICSGSPYTAKRCQTSGHSKWASTARKYFFPKKGPAKSMCTLCHGRPGQTQGWSGATAGNCLTDWQGIQDLTKSSTSLSRPGHQTWLLLSSEIRRGDHGGAPGES